MQVQILTPKRIIFNGEVVSITVPGTEGEFQLLKDHAPIVSSLKKGKIKLYSIVNSSTSLEILEDISDIIKAYEINGGFMEFNRNKGIILCL